MSVNTAKIEVTDDERVLGIIVPFADEALRRELAMLRDERDALRDQRDSLLNTNVAAARQIAQLTRDKQVLTNERDYDRRRHQQEIEKLRRKPFDLIASSRQGVEDMERGRMGNIDISQLAQLAKQEKLADPRRVTIADIIEATGVGSRDVIGDWCSAGVIDAVQERGGTTWRILPNRQLRRKIVRLARRQGKAEYSWPDEWCY